MAGFFGYDPYDYYTTPSSYPYDYGYSSLYNLPHYEAAAAPRRRASTFFPADAYASADFAEPAVRRRRSRSSAKPAAVSVPVQVIGSDRETEAEAEMRAAKRREDAAVRLQAAVRGFLARRMARMVREVRAVEAEAEEVERKVEKEAEVLRGDARGRIAVGEALMRLLLRLDAVRGAREYRRKVTKWVLALQDAVDALEYTPPVTAPVVEEGEVVDDGPAAVEVEAAPEVADDVTAAVDMEEEEGDDGAVENEMAPESPPRDAEVHGEAESKVEVESEAVVDAAVAETPAAEMELDGGGVKSTGGESEPERTAVEQVVGMADAEEDEWEMVSAAESASPAAPIHTDAVENSPVTEVPHEEAAGEEVKVKEAEEKKQEVATGEGVDAKKLMEMVAALCEQSAQQCAVIGALAERVEVLERAVRRAEEADRRRRRNKKLKKEGKGNNKKCIRSCYSD